MNEILKKEIAKFLQKTPLQQNKKIITSKIIIKQKMLYVILENVEKFFHQRIQSELSIFLKPNISNLELRILFSNSRQTQEKIRLAKKTILITSCKGGVGKSTISSLIAQKLAHIYPNKKTALLDADIYGPSIQQIFGINQKPEIIDNMMKPIVKYGVFINTIGAIIGDDQALTIRAPIANKTLFKIFSLTDWANPDYMIIDTPPGTGDIHLSILQNYCIDQIMLITTAQKLSAIDATRSIKLFQKFNLPITTIIENMSYLELEHEKIHIFQGNAAKLLKEKYNIANWKQIPMIPSLSNFCDSGKKLDKFFSLINLTNIDIES
ncbi:MAG: ATP-binding protein [Rickettsia sp.]|nr:ATP-binding protein [Rickettsia sp.]